MILFSLYKHISTLTYHIRREGKGRAKGKGRKDGIRGRGGGGGEEGRRGGGKEGRLDFFGWDFWG